MPVWSTIAVKVKSLLESQQGLVQNFTLSGDNALYSGTRTTLKREDWETDAGLVEGNYVFSLLCASGQFATLPAPRTTKVTVDGSTYRLLSIDADAIKATVKLNLGSILL